MKGTKSLKRSVIRTLSFKQFEERNGMQKNKMQNKRMQIKPISNVKIALNINC